MLQRLERFYPVGLNLLPILIMFSAIVYNFMYFEYLPDEIPLHFGFDGIPDSYTAKTLLGLFTVPLIGVLICGSLSLLNVFLVMNPEDPGKAINLPEKAKHELGIERMEELRTLTARSLCTLNIIVALMLAYLSYGTVQIALGEMHKLGSVFWLFIALILIISIGMIVKTVQLTSLPSKKH